MNAIFIRSLCRVCKYHDLRYFLNYKTGGRRVGVLCDRCNTIVLQAGDDPALLEAAAEYLRKHRRKNKRHYRLPVAEEAAS
ncbi:endonuclease domain-containing protein [Candidatus Sororendozoicomonas aggregata]|uniref:endonuclease domain-containing protein n=1 Tax=Candidatus Sororendozoicomonas aggregata TaxID=3073239 RepID=UPI003B75C82E